MDLYIRIIIILNIIILINININLINNQPYIIISLIVDPFIN